MRAVLALLFATAAIAKLSRFGGFIAAVRGYDVMPSGAAPVAAGTTVLAEAVISISLIGGIQVPTGFGVASILLLLFALADALALRTHPPADCGCLGGLLRLQPDWWSVGTNVMLAGVSAAAIVQPVSGLPFPVGSAQPGSSIIALWMAASLWVMVYWLGMYARTVRRTLNKAHAEGAT